MSQEEELIELSNVYHGTREYVEELQAGMRDCNVKIEALQALIKDYVQWADQGFTLTFERREVWTRQYDNLCQRAKELLGENNVTIDQSKSS